MGLAGHLISEENQILQVLAGLGQDYDAIVSSVSFARDTYTLSEIQAQLLAYEFRLNQRNNEFESMSANIAYGQNRRYQSSNSGNRNRGGYERDSYGYRGRGHYNNSG